MPVLFDPPQMHLAFDPDGDAASPWRFVGAHRYENTIFRYRVPHGARTDLTSAPLVARLWCNPNGRWQRAAAFHDVAYRTQDCTRYEADAMFRAIMLRDRCGGLRALAMYLGVRVGGWWAWRRHARRLAAQQPPPIDWSAG